MNVLRVFLLWLCVFVLITNSLSQVPAKISYQGLLTDSSGNSITDGNYALKFDVYDAPTGGTLRHTETFASVSIQRGTFNLILGTASTLPKIFKGPLYVEITALAGPSVLSYPSTFSPRTELTSAPYSLAPWSTSDSNVYFNSGNVGIGTAIPQATLDVAGFTMLGTDAPAIKVKKITGTTPSLAAGGTALWIPLGFSGNKVLSVSVLVQSDYGTWLLPNHPDTRLQYFVGILDNQFGISVGSTSSGVASKPFKVMIVYEE